MSLILDCLKNFSSLLLVALVLFWRQECAVCPRQASPQAWSLPLHPIPAVDLLPLQLAAQVRCDPQFGGIPETIHLRGEVLGVLVKRLALLVDLLR